MCDFTNDDGGTSDAGLTRRGFTTLGAAAVLASYGSLASAAGPLSEKSVAVKTADGTCDAFFVHPASGTHPGIILWPDILGLREAKKAMARRLAGEGYAVLVVNQYYRGTKAPIGMDWPTFFSPEGRPKLAPYLAALTPEAVTRDGAAYVAFLDAQAVVDKKRGIGTQGYCMGGPFTVRTAVGAPTRVKAAASFHGGGLVTDKPDSPHRLLGQTQAGYLFAIARNDDQKAPGDKDALRTAAAAAGRPAEIEVYAANHGWCVPDSPEYNAAEADRAWARLLALYAKL